MAWDIDVVKKKRTALSELVYNSLYSRIVNGDYEANQKLPSELLLAQEFSVSRPVLRTALKKLRDQGLIHSRKGAGNYVLAPTSEPLRFAHIETLADIQRYYEFRLTIETAAAALAAERSNDAILAEIDRSLDLLRAATASKLHREDADFAFHLAIACGANNPYFESTMRVLREHILIGMRLHGRSLMTDGTKGLERVLEEHIAIYDAISDKDAETAATLMRRHLENSRDRLFGAGLLDLKMT
ncbi:MAG: FadR family transcriptional regulator [Candidatus Competibacteraceae bacterium]|nr:FadR family transcriptional regulator [Candidatus Competibacteraceae bacterium]